MSRKQPNPPPSPPMKIAPACGAYQRNVILM
jgi:hypothetical protein